MRFTNPWVAHPNQYAWSVLSTKERVKMKAYCRLQRHLIKKAHFFVTQTDDVKNSLKSEKKTENNLENEKNLFDNYKDNNNLYNKDSIKNNITSPSIEISKSSFDNLLNETSVKKSINKNKKNEENEITKKSLDYEEGNY